MPVISIANKKKIMRQNEQSIVNFKRLFVHERLHAFERVFMFEYERVYMFVSETEFCLRRFKFTLRLLNIRKFTF